MAKAPIVIDVRVRQASQRATIANLRQYGRNVVKALEGITVKSGKRLQAHAIRLAPVDEGYMRTKIHLVISARRLAFQVGYDESDFIGKGLAFYPVFQELGFRHWITGAFIQNPHLRPAFDIEYPRYYRDVAQALRTQASRLRRAG